jgi:hypothetical protein
VQGLDLFVMAPISLTYLTAAQKNTDVEFIKGIATLILKCRPCPFIQFFFRNSLYPNLKSGYKDIDWPLV